MKRLKDAVDDPLTLVDRLRGIYVNGSGDYPDASPPYKTPLIQQEAAREIERLRAEVERLKRELLFARVALMPNQQESNPYINKKPAGAG